MFSYLTNVFISQHEQHISHCHKWAAITNIDNYFHCHFKMCVITNKGQLKRYIKLPVLVSD